MCRNSGRETCPGNSPVSGRIIALIVNPVLNLVNNKIGLDPSSHRRIGHSSSKVRKQARRQVRKQVNLTVSRSQDSDLVGSMAINPVSSQGVVRISGNFAGI
ncbi:MAG: hypothetical protein A2W80_08825 [Candidatus Riflebacteria bacterium GWC2_50_8]|nr:MAG: hypothetical protein A2W80_08825 [Candidatus Riflebacteria bacterium GWC2_50_8]